MKLSKREERIAQLERAELFSGLLEEYLAEHEGEDEDIKTLELGDVPRVQKLLRYYD